MTTPTGSNNTLYKRNLAALRAIQPDVADRVAEVAIPHAVAPALGRDGSRSYRIRHPDGRATWFGRSSMPRVSAEAVFSGLHRDRGNVWLPGVITGLEPLVVARRIPDHRAVFVLEQDMLAVKIALHLYDYVPCFSKGRVVIISIADLDASLARFFQRYPGYELPTHLLTVPQVSAARSSELQRRIEQAGRAVAERQHAELESVVRTVRGRPSRDMPDRPTVAVLSNNPSPLVLEQAARITRGLASLELPRHLCVPDVPGKCHALAWLGILEGSSVDCVIDVGDGGRCLRPLLPPKLPVATVCVPGEPAPIITPEQVGLFDLLFAPSSRVEEQWMASGLSPEQIRRCPPGADDGVLSHSKDVDGGKHEADFAVALLMDLPDTSAQACGIGLTSHITLWRALQDIAARRVSADDRPQPNAWLAKAAEHTGVTLRDAALRERFLSLIRHRLVPATVRRAAARSVLDAGRRPIVWGQGWTPSLNLPVTVAGDLPVGPARRPILRATQTILLPDLCSRAVELAVDALGLGAEVVFWGDRHEFAREYPGLATIVDTVHFANTPSELTRILATVKPGYRECAAREQRVRLIRKAHSTSHRISGIIKELRERRSTAAVQPCGSPAAAFPMRT